MTKISAEVTKKAKALSSTLAKSYDKKALAELRKLCKQHGLALSDYVQRASRRSLIMKALKDDNGLWDTETLAKMLAEMHGYDNIADNKRAIAGTMYDMRGKGTELQIAENGAICSK